MTQAEKDWRTVEMIRSLYVGRESIHAETIIALCAMLDNYLIPKLDLEPKQYALKIPREERPDHLGGVTHEGHGKTPDCAEGFKCQGGPDLV